jgi:hypothetical protein
LLQVTDKTHPNKTQVPSNYPVPVEHDYPRQQQQLNTPLPAPHPHPPLAEAKVNGGSISPEQPPSGFPGEGGRGKGSKGPSSPLKPPHPAPHVYPGSTPDFQQLLRSLSTASGAPHEGPNSCPMSISQPEPTPLTFPPTHTQVRHIKVNTQTQVR